MSPQVKVFVMHKDQFNLVLRAAGRVRNLPADAEIVAASHVGADLGFLVYSPSFPCSVAGRPHQTVTAVVERIS